MKKLILVIIPSFFFIEERLLFTDPTKPRKRIVSRNVVSSFKEAWHSCS